jgi:hypothetical protein
LERYGEVVTCAPNLALVSRSYQCTWKTKSVTIWPLQYQNRLCKETDDNLLDACTIFSLYEYIFHPMNTYLDIMLKVAPPIRYRLHFSFDRHLIASISCWICWVFIEIGCQCVPIHIYASFIESHVVWTIWRGLSRLQFNPNINYLTNFRLGDVDSIIGPARRPSGSGPPCTRTEATISLQMEKKRLFIIWRASINCISGA